MICVALVLLLAACIPIGIRGSTQFAPATIATVA
jgi:hypothetical protein